MATAKGVGGKTSQSGPASIDRGGCVVGNGRGAKIMPGKGGGIEKKKVPVQQRGGQPEGGAGWGLMRYGVFLG